MGLLIGAPSMPPRAALCERAGETGRIIPVHYCLCPCLDDVIGIVDNAELAINTRNAGRTRRRRRNGAPGERELAAERSPGSLRDRQVLVPLGWSFAARQFAGSGGRENCHHRPAAAGKKLSRKSQLERQGAGGIMSHGGLMGRLPC